MGEGSGSTGSVEDPSPDSRARFARYLAVLGEASSSSAAGRSSSGSTTVDDAIKITTIDH